MEERFKRKLGESDESYQIRLTLMKQEGIDLDWSEIAEFVGDGRSSEAYRKDSYGIRRYHNSIDKSSENEVLLEIKKERVKLNDLKRLVNKQTRELSRWEEMIDVFKDSIINNQGKQFISNKIIAQESTGRDAILMISDIHFGLKVNNNVNQYDTDIAIERLNKLVDETISRCKINKIDKLNVVILGDTISGIIHNTLRLENLLDLGDQIIQVSEVLVQCIKKLANSEEIPFVTVTSVRGNHERVFPKKDDCLPQDDFTKLINNNLKKDLKDVINVCYLDENINHDEIALLNIRGKTFACVHGDKLSKEKCKSQLEEILNINLDYILMGHYHQCEQKQIFNTKLIINGSVIGTDSYAIQKKLYTNPSQKLLFIDDYGLCVYDIEL